MEDLQFEKIFVCLWCYKASKKWCYVGQATEYGYVDTNGSFHLNGYEPADEVEYCCPNCMDGAYYTDVVVELTFDNVRKTVKIKAPNHKDYVSLIEALEEYYTFDGYAVYVNDKIFSEAEMKEKEEKKKPALWGW